MTQRGAFELPTGTITFLFSDMEHSTMNVASLGDARYAGLLDVMRTLQREAFAAHDGAEVGTEGDSFFIAFARAADAVAAALDAQRRMEAHPWPEDARLRVRVGVHTGEALVTEEGYVGHDVHKAKRVCDAGHGGQILLSQTTFDIVGSHLPPGAAVTDLGPHRLKDLGEPQRLYQLSCEGLQATFPALRSLDLTRHNLPPQLTSFVGRQRELEEVRSMLASNRLVTLTGVGGCGKTRLAIHAAAAELERSPDGVYFCDLSRVSEEDAVVPAIAAALKLDLSGQEARLPALDTARAYLADRNVLLVLDNCEHLVDAAAAAAEEILVACPGVRILATSREALEVEGELAWSVPSLDTAADATRLFAERAAAVRSGFEVTDANAAEVRAICERLDGMPLAIELAAAQMSHLGAKQISERLDDRFVLLTGGRRRIQRQQTLQAAMDWSWELLDERNRTLLTRLGVFQGGFTLEAAEAVCGDGIDVVAGLRSLVAKSLVVVQGDGSARYRLLETVRLYAEEKLSSSDDVKELRGRHRDYFNAWGAKVRLKWGPMGNLQNTPYADEVDNIRAALRWSEAEGRQDLVAEVLLNTPHVWQWYFEEGQRRLNAALEHDHSPQLRGRLLARLSLSLSAMGAGGGELAAEAIALSDEPTEWLVMALSVKAIADSVSAIAQRDQARADQAIDGARKGVAVGEVVGNIMWTNFARTTLGMVQMMQLRYEDALRTYVDLTNDARAEWSMLDAADVLFAVPHIKPELATPEVTAAHRLAVTRFVNYFGFRPASDALAEALAGREDEALKVLAAGEERWQIAPPLVQRIVVVYGGLVAAALGYWEKAARLLGAAMQPGIILRSSGYALYRHWLPTVRANLEPDLARRLRDEGRAMSLDQAIAYSLTPGDVAP